MKIELKKKIVDLIAAYQANFDQSNAELAGVLDQYKDKVNKYHADYLHQAIVDGMAEIQSNTKAVNKLFNQQLKSLIADAKKTATPMCVTANKEADYAARVSNAIQFILNEGDEITDESAFLILKDFLDDYKQMKIFKNMIGKKVDLETATGNTTFPNTFGNLNKVEVKLNLFNEIEGLANTLFLYEDSIHQTYIVNRHGYDVPTAPALEETFDEDSIVKFAASLDKIVKNEDFTEDVETVTPASLES